MSEAEQPIEWYLARDGQQHGPISPTEMSKIIELGYLQPTDLVWRFGFPDWQPAAQVFPVATPPPSTPARPSPEQPTHRAAAEPATAPVAQRPMPEPALPSEEDARAVVAREAARREEAQRRQREEEAARRRAAEAAAIEAPVTRPTQPLGGQRVEAPRQEPFTPGGPRQPMPGPEPQRAHPQPGQLAPASLHARLEPISAAQPAKPRTIDPDRPGGAAPAAHRQGRSHPMPAAQPVPRLDVPPPAAPPAYDSYDEAQARRRFPWAAVIAALFIAGAGGAGYVLYRSGQLAPVLAMVGLGSENASTVRSAEPKKARTPPGTLPPAQVLRAGYSSTPSEVDSAFQQLPLWQLLKRDFPDWYRDRVGETARLKSEGKADLVIAQYIAERLVELRRKHVGDALAASPSRLKMVATTFLENLERLNKHSIDACYGFISQGETNPLIVELMRASEHAPALQAQAAAVFQAIAEGRRAPMKHAQPTREDYDKLATQLSKRGWSPADLQLFSDARSLSRAPPERVCKMVQDWFAAQLAVGEEDVQVRLLIEALKPVVAG